MPNLIPIMFTVVLRYVTKRAYAVKYLLCVSAYRVHTRQPYAKTDHPHCRRIMQR